ncbi:MAG: filamentous hemagglutinin N-terminal domain-containing protein, partial [Myxococcota bacterium]|nr:filamentous hemagglutinin N-terminal domain-containing protein [Myxococcota bacterium]
MSSFYYYDESDYNYSAHDRSGPGDRLGKAPDRPAAPSSMVPLAAKKFGESPVRRSVPRVAAILLLAACWAGAAHANQGLIVRDDSMGVGQGLAVGPGIDPDFSPNNGQVDYLIPSEMGTTRGENLFHSFSRFGIGLGEVASFIGDAGAIARIIARVTGSEGSQVDGVMRSSVAGADVFLLNPNGVIFGPSGAIDVQGSFAVSTADRLEFSDGLFDVADVAAPWGGSACCGGGPTAYLFAGADAATAGDPAEIKIEIRTGFGGYVDVPVGEQVSAVGGMITVGEGRVILTGGAILFAATGHATVRVPVDLALDGTWNVALGDEAAIRLGPGSKLYTSNPVDFPSGNGRVVLRGGRLELDTAEVSAGGPDGGGVDLWFSGDVDLTGLQVGSLIFPALIIDRSSGPQADGIRLVAGTLSLNDFSQIATTAGALGLEAETVSLGHLSRIASTTGGITLSAGTLSLDDFALIEATAGKIDITSQGATRVENGAVIRTITAFENSGAPVDAGDLDLKAGSLELISGGQINSLTGSGSAPGSDPRAAGNIDITVTDGLRIEGRIGITDPDTGDVSFARSGILARALEGATAEASGGNITVTAGSVEMANGASVSASSKTGASAGSITITAGSSIRLTGGVVAAGEELAEISSRGHGGPAGNVHVEAASIEVLDGAAISASSQEAGRAGDVTVIANHLRVSGRSTQGAGGPVSQASAIYAEAPTDSTVPGGSAGKLDVRLQDGLEISEGGELSVRTRGSGSAGAVVVRVEQGSIDISSGGRVLSQSTATHAGAGAAG